SAPPYRATASDEVLRQVQASPPLSIFEVARGAPRDLASIVDRAMARDPASRYANAAELAKELRRFQTGQVVAAHHYSVRERMRRLARRHRGIVIGVATGLSALLVIGTIALRSVLRERDRADAQRAVAEQTNAELLEEQGRQELLRGNPLKAAVWLSA